MKRTVLTAAAIALLTALAATWASAADDDKVPVRPYPPDISYGETGMGVIFSHEFHVDSMGYACADCHGDLFQLKAGAARENGDFNMNSMYEGKYCGHCHNGDTAFDASDYNNCGTCHNGAKPEETWKVVGPSEDLMLGPEGSQARFSHKVHQDMFGCDECHTSLFPVKYTGTITTMDDINAGKACGTCHNGDFAFGTDDCSACHPDM